MNELMIFEGNNVEVFEFEDKVLFNPRDIAKCLNLGDSAIRMAIGKMSDKQVIKVTNSDVKVIDFRKLNNAGENFLTENGVYKLIFKSNKEEAEKFQDWIADEVLPSIRKDGGYIIGKENDTPEEILARAILVAQSTLQRRDARIKQLEIQERVNKPYVDFANKVADTADAIDIGTFAKLVKDEGVNIGRNKLFSFLRDNKYLDNKNVPYQKYINNGYFKIIEQVFKTVYGNKVNIKTLLLGIGQIKIMNRLKEEFGNE